MSSSSERRDVLGRRIGYNWWREWITSEWFLADQAWWVRCEDETLLYSTEMDAYKQWHPRPNLKDFMLAYAGMSQENHRL